MAQESGKDALSNNAKMVTLPWLGVIERGRKASGSGVPWCFRLTPLGRAVFAAPDEVAIPSEPDEPFLVVQPNFDVVALRSLETHGVDVFECPIGGQHRVEVVLGAWTVRTDVDRAVGAPDVITERTIVCDVRRRVERACRGGETDGNGGEHQGARGGQCGEKTFHMAFTREPPSRVSITLLNLH